VRLCRRSSCKRMPRDLSCCRARHSYVHRSRTTTPPANLVCQTRRHTLFVQHNPFWALLSDRQHKIILLSSHPSQHQCPRRALPPRWAGRRSTSNTSMCVTPTHATAAPRRCFASLLYVPSVACNPAHLAETTDRHPCRAKHPQLQRHASPGCETAQGVCFLPKPRPLPLVRRWSRSRRNACIHTAY
jgi:hypothetical protein